MANPLAFANRLVPALQNLLPFLPPDLTHSDRWFRLLKLPHKSQNAFLKALDLPIRPPYSSDLISKVVCVIRNLRSQFREDLLLLPHFLRTIPVGNGSFVELGALDGVLFSNSLLYERCFGYHGVLIEANPANFAQLQQSNRTAAKVHAAVACSMDTPGRTIKMTQDGGETAALVSVQREWQRSSQASTGIVDVPCRSLTGILQSTGFSSRRISFMSLDVEGAEEMVLRTVNPAVFENIIVEMHSRTNEDRVKAQTVHTILISAGLQKCTSPPMFWRCLYARGNCPFSP